MPWRRLVFTPQRLPSLALGLPSCSWWRWCLGGWYGGGARPPCLPRKCSELGVWNERRIRCLDSVISSQSVSLYRMCSILYEWISRLHIFYITHCGSKSAIGTWQLERIARHARHMTHA
ncbi:hypothetical protein BCR44DRAFT_1253357 [Catenaria anguillulae PL171]|uniref:Secreted protein n=1 Tax=Catenaria anguillulae PL171 TaxID=765915 RepID=A0A1Y2HC64_9FUNG|nr:hypothetical protein BCR44DRAFT_1253357 [Catenaria anguillulae PL171]